MWIFFGKMWISSIPLIEPQWKKLRGNLHIAEKIIHFIHRIHIFSSFFRSFSFRQYAYFFFIFLMIYFETLIQFGI